MYPVCTLRCTPSASSTYRTVRFAGASVARLVRSSLSSLRDENLCIIRANGTLSMEPPRRYRPDKPPLSYRVQASQVENSFLTKGVKRVRL